MTRGRPKGCARHLTDEQVRVLRRTVGKISDRAAGTLLGVSGALVGHVRRGLSYKEIQQGEIGRPRKRRPDICEACNRNTKSPFFDGCANAPCERGHTICL